MRKHLLLIENLTFVMASVFWNVTAPGTIFVVLSKGPLVAAVTTPWKQFWSCLKPFKNIDVNMQLTKVTSIL